MDASRAAKHILCIDDDKEIADLVAEELCDRGYRVTVCYGGRAGHAALLRDEPDLVLCDLSLPDLSGFDLLQRLKPMAPRFRNLPFIFLTAISDRESELKARQLGADDYVVKPADFDILAMIIEARLAGVARRQTAAETVTLNKKEIEVLTWAARGKTSEEIACIVALTKRTVDYHADNARAKLNAVTRMHAVVKAASSGLISL